LLDTFLYALVIIPISLMLLIGWHEYGHCWTAKRLGIKVIRFAIGFGKPLFIKRSRDGTEYALCALPLGGYVKLADTIVQQSIYKRACIIVAGPFFNLLLGLMAYWLVFMIGIVQPLPIIGNITAGSLAAKSGLKVNQQIISIDDKPTSTWTAIVFRLIPHLGRSDKLEITVKNTEHITSSHVIPLTHWQLDTLRPNLLLSLGISPETTAIKLQKRQYSFFSALIVATKETLLLLQANSIVLAKIFTGSLSLKSLIGPIGLLAGTLKAAHQGFTIYLTFIGFISVGLAFINLLPIPGLDGSHLLYLLIESIIGKPVSIPLQMLLLRLGMIALTLLMIQALMNDLLRLT
jgi:regulator of sigma E protease